MASSLITQSVIETHTPLDSHRHVEAESPVESRSPIAEALQNDDMQEDLVQVFKLLSSGPRLQILAHLVREGELNVTDLCHRIHQTQPAVSHHLALLRLNKLLVLRRDGKHSFYSVNPARLQGVLQNLADIVLGQNSDELEMSDFRLTRVG